MKNIPERQQDYSVRALLSVLMYDKKCYHLAIRLEPLKIYSEVKNYISIL